MCGAAVFSGNVTVVADRVSSAIEGLLTYVADASASARNSIMIQDFLRGHSHDLGVC